MFSLFNFADNKEINKANPENCAQLVHRPTGYGTSRQSQSTVREFDCHLPANLENWAFASVRGFP